MKKTCTNCGLRPTEHHRTVCGTCRIQKYRRENPIKAAYIALRDNAKRRRKEFTLTLEQFEKFCIETEYIIKKGISKQSYTIDRIRDTEGYHIHNIQVLTNSDNVKKMHRVKKVQYDWESKQYWTADITPQTTQHDDCPF